MFLFGWDMKQWAIAAAVIKPQGSSLEDAAACQTEWRKRYQCDPGALDLAGVERPEDWDFVERLLSENRL